jgi:hypothetical protein
MNNFAKLLILSFIFFFMYTNYFSAYYLVAQIYEQIGLNDLGLIALIVNNIFYTIGNFLASSLI